MNLIKVFILIAWGNLYEEQHIYMFLNLIFNNLNKDIFK